MTRNEKLTPKILTKKAEEETLDANLDVVKRIGVIEALVSDLKLLNPDYPLIVALEQILSSGANPSNKIRAVRHAIFTLNNNGLRN